MKDKIWTGRFEAPTDALMEEFSNSLHFDVRLFEADVAVNKAWADALSEIGVYTQEESDQVKKAFDEIVLEFHAGRLEFPAEAEDIHSANELWLTARLGELGQRIHTGRSRNDQVMTDVKIYLKIANKKLRLALQTLQQSLLSVAREHMDIIFPAQTHLRQAQPMLYSHYLLSFFFQLQRDCERLMDAYKRCDEMPLGAGALAGAAYPVNRKKLADALGFKRPSPNSYDAISDRDTVLELAHCCSNIMIHLSRVAEDLILWSSENYKFIELHDKYTTGSSMMPQKKNPDALELIRGKTARVIGEQVAGLTLMKGIPTSYVRDLQEDKEPLFISLDQTLQSVQIFEGVIRTLRANGDEMTNAIDPALYATDMADYLVKKGIPFRKAHGIVGEIVADAEKKGVPLSELSLEDFRKHSQQFENDVTKLFDPRSSADKRNIEGGTGAQSVKKQLALAESLLQK